jgi:hypothetical protein
MLQNEAVIGELGRDRLAEDHGARRPQPFRHGGIAHRATAGVDARPHFGRHVVRIEDVLEPDRDAVERPDRAAGFASFVGIARAVER